jgi:hypothetical protein
LLRTSPRKGVRLRVVMLREVRLVNLLNSPRRQGSVGSHIVSENRRRLVMERNCLETSTTRIFDISHEYFPGIFIPHKTRPLPRKNS